MTEPSNQEPGWERRLLEKLASDSIVEQRRRRRWGIFFKLLGLVYLTVVLLKLAGFDFSLEHDVVSKHTALVDLRGVIADHGEASAESIMSSLQNAFQDKNTQGVVLRINSPGGSPVQSGMINDEIYRLRKLYPSIPLYAVVEDICASGGYYVAVAADQIFVNKASILGSIGVLMDGFGFTGSMEKLGVERRLLTAGSNKGFLDPFSPQDAHQKEHAQLLLNDVHQQFIQVVRKGRGERLKETPDLFSGLMWTGQRSLELGLADAYGSVESVARDVVKAGDIVDFTQKQNLAERVAKKLGADMANQLEHFLLQSRLR
ncbi:MAG: S49 family peptidase [Rhodocyclaceae bacterium]|nr:S49 family peptidase [Rhodocyclaceae bacterium]